MSLQGLLAKFYDVCSQTLGNSFESWGTSHCKNLANDVYRYTVSIAEILSGKNARACVSMVLYLKK